jgi:hypothetical protein
MAIPNISVTVLSTGLGNVAPSPSGTFVVFGCSSGGTEEVVSGPYYRPDLVVTDYGYGPGPELVAECVQSGIPTIFVKVATDTVGTKTAVTHTGTGTSVMTVTGDPFDQYDIVVTATRSGTAGSDPEPGFTISFDGGVTVTREIRMPANRIYTGFAATTGLTFNFTAATLVEDDTYELTTTAPTWAAVDVASAIAAMVADRHEVGLGYVVGAATKSQADTISTAVEGFTTRQKYIRFMIEARDINVAGGETEAQWMASISADYATFQSNRVSVGAGACLAASAITGINYRRNIGTLALVRAGRRVISRDLGAVEDGALCATYSGVNQTGPLEGTPVSVVYHDEAGTPGLDADRFMTVRSFTGLIGYYICNPNIMCAPTSDFTLLQYGRVMDEACRTTVTFFTTKLSTDVRLDRRTGFILERDALALESGSDSALQTNLLSPGYASGAETNVSRSDNISTTKTLTVTVLILPLAYIKTVAEQISFVNPALGSIAA